MRRLAFATVIAVTLPTAARAQACLGSVSFATVPVRLGGGAIFGKDYTAYAASLIAGKDNAAFGDVGVSRTYIDGYDDTGDPRIAELPDHPFYLATLFQPELAGDGTRPHALIEAFARAAASKN